MLPPVPAVVVVVVVVGPLPPDAPPAPAVVLTLPAPPAPVTDDVALEVSPVALVALVESLPVALDPVLAAVLVALLVAPVPLALALDGGGSPGSPLIEHAHHPSALATAAIAANDRRIKRASPRTCS
jgi:hypothetical protein